MRSLKHRGNIRVLFWLFSLTLVSLPLTSCSPKPAKVEKISIFTGGVAGTYYPLGEALAKIINGKVKGVEALVVSSEGSVANARAIAGKEARLALIQNDIADYAYRGTEMFDGSRVDNIRGIASWYPQAVQFVTLKESGIKSISELKGKRVGVGAPESGTMVEALAILGIAGINRQNTTILNLDFAEVAIALQNGTIEAGCIVSGIPTPAVIDVANSRDVYILEIPDEIYYSVKQQHPFFVRQLIPSGTYKGLDKDTSTVAVMAMLVTRADLPEEIIYNVTKVGFENLDILVAAHTSAKDININTALEGMTIPLHPGAQRYYREKGWVK